MSYYVKRSDPPHGDASRIGWVGPIPSGAQAHKEADAWRSAGWRAQVVESTPAVHAEVRAWQRAADIRLGRALPPRRGR